MSRSTDDRIQKAIEFVKAGDKASAKRILTQNVKENPESAHSWYLLSQLVDDQEQVVYCLEKAVDADPLHVKAARRLEQLKPAPERLPTESIQKPLSEKATQKKKRPNIFFIGLVGLLAVCGLCAIGSLILNSLGLIDAETPIVPQAKTDEPLEIVSTNTIEPDIISTTASVIEVPITTESPTSTLPPTETPTLTLPPPTNTPEIVPEVVIPYSGVGDSIVDIDLAAIGGKGVLQVQGNQESRHFSVTGYDSGGNMVALFVNTTEPYLGRRALNLNAEENVARFEVSATGAWEIKLISLSENLIAVINVPGSYVGNGDDVLLLRGGQPDTATVSGNSTTRHFALTAFTQGLFPLDLLINTTDPYNGVVLMEPTTFALEFAAVGEWSIDISTK